MTKETHYEIWYNGIGICDGYKTAESAEKAAKELLCNEGYDRDLITICLRIGGKLYKVPQV
ncbi:MAG: hypothetical protein LBQ54_07500 [Planctomycetaceae bacterium]|nr:hypothetical protein [Planctomycetaceae bacterium]